MISKVFFFFRVIVHRPREGGRSDGPPPGPWPGRWTVRSTDVHPSESHVEGQLRAEEVPMHAESGQHDEGGR